jgi:hypothetical protein
MGDAPRWLCLLADWVNVCAAISLIISFSVYFIALQVGHCDPRGGTPLNPDYPDKCVPSAANTGIIFNGMNTDGPNGSGEGWFLVAKWTMALEGFGWWLGGVLLCYRNICGGNAAGAVSQCIIATGGFFFTCSAWGNPANIISLRYLVPTTVFDAPGSTGSNFVSFSDVCPYYGIMTFFIATTMGMYSVAGLPKNKIISPFWGVCCFFIGAWIIGIVTLYVPMLSGGFTKWEDIQGVGGCITTPEAGTCMLDMPTFAWYPLKIAAVIGAIFLLFGGLIFGMLDNFLGLPQGDEKLLPPSPEQVSLPTNTTQLSYRDA